MNKLLLLIFSTIVFLLTTNCLSQTGLYKPFPEVYGKWIVTKTAYAAPSCPSPSYTNWKQYEAMGDTTIGAYSYKKVYVASNTGYPPFGSNVPPFGPGTFSFGYRNDIPNKKVYYLDCTGGLNKDTLMFDFNLTLGSSLSRTYAYYYSLNSGDSTRRIVTAIDSIEICGTYYKRFNFACSAFETSLIEGQGFADRFFDTDYDDGCPFEPCVIYDTEFFSCFNTAMKKENVVEVSITIYPNPVTKELNIDAPKLYIKETTIFDINGKCVMITPMGSAIDISKLNTGIYFIKIRTDKGEFSQKFIKE